MFHPKYTTIDIINEVMEVNDIKYVYNLIKIKSFRSLGRISGNKTTHPDRFENENHI
jgi:hypothetical protein